MALDPELSRSSSFLFKSISFEVKCPKPRPTRLTSYNVSITNMNARTRKERQCLYVTGKKNRILSTTGFPGIQSFKKKYYSLKSGECVASPCHPLMTFETYAAGCKEIIPLDYKAPEAHNLIFFGFCKH